MILKARSPRSRCQQGWFLLRPLSLACRRPSSPWVLLWPSRCVSLCPNLLFLQGPIGSCPTLMTSFNLNHLFKDPVSTYSHILRRWGLGLQHVSLLGGCNSIHNKNSLPHGCFVMAFTFSIHTQPFSPCPWGTLLPPLSPTEQVT